MCKKLIFDHTTSNSGKEKYINFKEISTEIYVKNLLTVTFMVYSPILIIIIIIYPRYLLTIYNYIILLIIVLLEIHVISLHILKDIWW